MAQNFKNFLTRNIGTSAVAINDATNTFDTLIGIRLCNVATSQILMDVYITRSSTNYYLAFNVPIPSGGQYEVMDGDGITQYYVTMDPGSIELKTPPVLLADCKKMAEPIFEAAQRKGVMVAFEAGVAGGIPIINALRDGLSANHIESIMGIMNGTCNYMMTKMTNEGVTYDAILKESQELGYAEADPTFDVGGFDAAHKLLILASIAYGIDAKPEDILIEGIENVSSDDIAFAKEFGYAIKLLGIAKKDANEVELRVHACLIPQEKMIAKIDGVMNGISVVGDKVGETLYYGPGAGGDATASAVVANIIDIARGGKSTPMLGFDRPMEGKELTLKPSANIESKYYLRVNVSDRAGVLAKITKIFETHNISIETMLQRPSQNLSANLLISTHVAIESNIQAMISELEALDFINARPVMIRIV